MKGTGERIVGWVTTIWHFQCYTNWFAYLAPLLIMGRILLLSKTIQCTSESRSLYNENEAQESLTFGLKYAIEKMQQTISSL